MSFKLIFRNVRRSIKEYGVYFLTLTLAVSLFYAFNSINAQPAMSSISTTRKFMSETMDIYIGYLSKITAVVLAFLILYANQYIMKRRKKEMGIYMILGMDKEKISRIFIGETLLVGIIALGSGILLGIVLSQGLSMLALKLFIVDMSQFKLIFSLKAFSNTIVSFIIIFFIVMIFNTWTITNVKLIDLLKAERKNEELKSYNPWISTLLFILSIGILGYTFYFIKDNGLLNDNIKDNIKIFIILICSGTLLFYYSITGAFLNLVKRNKKFYFHRLNVFLFRQIGSKIKTHFFTITLLCGLLTCALTVLGTGISVITTMNSEAIYATPYDITIIYPNTKRQTMDIFERAKTDKIPLEESLNKFEEITIYSSDYKYKDLFEGQDYKLWNIDSKLPELPVQIISEKDFNKTMRLQGKEEISLGEGSFLFNCNYKGTKQYVGNFLKTNNSIKINGIALLKQSEQLLNETIIMTSVGNNDRGTLVVPDNITALLKPDVQILNGQYKDNVDPDSFLIQINNAWCMAFKEGIRFQTKDRLYDIHYGSFGLIAFISSYIGLIFTIICLAILSLQQLTEISDNIYSYGLLKRLGTDSKLIEKTVIKQIAIYFFTPLIPALAISKNLINEILNIAEVFLNMNIWQDMITTIGAILLVYIVYFFATYTSCKRIVKENG